MTKTKDKTKAKPDRPAETTGAEARVRVLLVTGMSGAGRTAALKSLEDMGYEAVDNLPLSLLASLVGPSAGLPGPLAIGIDIRTRDFGVRTFLRGIDDLIARPDIEARLVFLDCEDEVLRRRYSVTRHRHPLALDRPLTDGIRHERRLLDPLRDRADVVIETSEFTLGDLKRVLDGHFALEASPGLTVFVTSFSYRHGLPPEADIVLDARFLANPHYVERLKPLTGRDEEVGTFIVADPDYPGFFHSVTEMLSPLLPRFSAEGKSYLTIAVGCTGGRHRSVFLVEQLAGWLAERGEQVATSHRELEASGEASKASGEASKGSAT